VTIGASLLLLLLAAAGPATLAAQSTEEIAPPARGEDLTVYVMTMGPGPLVYERFGHNAIWIRDRARGTDIAYNYGMFSFDQDNFLLRFVRGHMDYWMAGFDAGMTASDYIAADRSVWAQELNLTPAQRADLQEFLEWNALPENSVYRYDYYRDNCSTRVRDAIDLAVGGRLRVATESLPTGTTFRDHTRALTVNDPPLYVGLMAGLGQPVDLQISVWEEMFLPMQLRERIRDLTIIGEDGVAVPLVLSEVEVFRSTRTDEMPIPPTREWAYLVVGLILAAGVWFSGRMATVHRGARVVFGVLAGGWSLIGGLLGVILFMLWVFTDHATSYRNENLFHLSPFLLPLVGLLHTAVRGSVRGRRLAFMVATAVAAISLLGFVLKVLPGFVQVNGELIAVALPMNVAIALVAWRLDRASREDGRSPSRAESRVEPEPVGA
jgi:hypothetical protein